MPNNKLLTNKLERQQDNKPTTNKATSQQQQANNKQGYKPATRQQTSNK
jgi:hypothetical protein